MQTLSVIIPFFQADPGILKRALQSVLSQNVPAGWLIEVVVIDDGSPCPADDDVRELEFRYPLRIKVIRQENGGVAKARNRGLDEADQDAVLIAFLDSDDIWPPHHLAHAIGAQERGFDFYFTDNCRDVYHETHCRSPLVVETAAFISASPQKTGLLEIEKNQMMELLLLEVPCQTSTVVYRYSVNKNLRFNERIKRSGEDFLFFATILSLSSRICFDLGSVVQCGRGVNIFFSNVYDWDGKHYLEIRIDQLVSRRLVSDTVPLSTQNRRLSNELLATCRRELAFHMVRNIAKHPARVPQEVVRLIKLDPVAAMMLPMDMARIALGYAFGAGRREPGLGRRSRRRPDRWA